MPPASDIAVRSASAIAGLIAGKLGGLVCDEATLLWKFKDDVDGMRETMEFVNALMHDADARQASHQHPEEHVRALWMKKFKSVAYNVEDLLDKFEAIELLRQNQSKMKLFFSTCNSLYVRVTMAHKIKKVKKDLDSIKEDVRNLNLVPNDNMPRSAEGSIQATIPWTNENVDIGIIGRDNEKENIIKLLLKQEAEEHISIIPIVGLGGLGKTTLAQAILSDKRVKIFDLRVWVFVSRNFDLPGIGTTIISNASASIGNITTERHKTAQNGDLPSIIEKLKTILSTKRYLIVLDDIWEVRDDNLQKLQQILQHGAKGSKVILTTRIQRVVERLGVGVLAEQRIICPVRGSDRINLNGLSDDDCWHVMQSAMGQHDGVVARLEEIGKEIARKCSGLPLLARSLGFLLSQNKSTEAWEDVRDRKLILDITEDHESQEALERLMLSYYYMPFKVKLCFTYCAVLPKGFAIARDHLIQQWRALGYIQSVHDDNYCVNYLMGTSFLMASKASSGSPGDSEATIKVTIHDLVHDLATMITGKELIVSDASDDMKWTGPEQRYSKHMRIVNDQKQPKVLKEFPGKIRSLQFTECNGIQLHQKSFSKSDYLRVLDISSIDKKPVPNSISLPSSIYRLVLLRYLDASSLPITSLPKSLHKFQNMQTLIMSNCALETLPDSIGCLRKLCHLDLSGNRSLNKLPISFGELSALSFLKLSRCSTLDELPESIHKLEGLRHLDMSGCYALENLPDNFGGLPKLLSLNLSSCSKLVKLPDCVNLKSLEQLNLSSCHELQSLPHNFGYLNKLELLDLSDCYKVQLLPESFCQLKNLKELDLSDCYYLKELPECFGNLSKLQSLDLTSCSKLQSLPESFGGLAKLKNLHLSYCVRLENLPSSFCTLKQLQVLCMKALLNLKKLPHGIGNMTSLTLFEIYPINKEHIDYNVPRSILRHLQLDDRTTKHTVYYMDQLVGYEWHSSLVNIGKLACDRLEIKHLENVEYPEDAERAKIRDNPDLRQLSLSWDLTYWIKDKRDAKVLEKLMPPRTLEGFQLLGYHSRNFPNWILEISAYLPLLTSIELVGLLTCDSLPPLGMLLNLRLLHIENIPNITKIGKEFYGEEGACKKLRIIGLTSLENLEEWWTTRSGEEEDEFLIPNLHRLRVVRCPKLKFLPYPPKSMYWDLDCSEEVLPMHGFGRLSSSILPFDATIKSMNFTADKWGRLQHLATLEELACMDFHGSLRCLPEATPCFPSLRSLHLALCSLEILPEWLGQLITLEELTIMSSPNLTSLPESIRNLTALKRLNIWFCPRLVEKCKGEDAHKIFHIPEVDLDAQDPEVYNQSEN